MQVSGDKIVKLRFIILFALFRRNLKNSLIIEFHFFLKIFHCYCYRIMSSYSLWVLNFISYSRSRSPLKRERSLERAERRSRSPRDSRSPKRSRSSPPPSKGRKRSPSPNEGSPLERGSPSPRDGRQPNGSDYSGSPRRKSRSPIDDADGEGPRDRSYRSPAEENGNSRSPSPVRRDDRSPVDDDENHGSPRGSESN